jgi:hemerythrin superfamily protein
MTQRGMESAGPRRARRRGQGSQHRADKPERSAVFMDRVAGAVGRGLRVLKAAANALVEQNVETDALEMLSVQHRHVERLFESLEHGRRREGRQALLDELTESLVVHASIEEQVFYPSVRSELTEDLLMESMEEHLAMKRTLLDLISAGVDDETFQAKLATLKEQVLHHAKQEEERKLFPLLRELMSVDQREGLAQELTAAMVEAQEGPTPRQRLVREVESASARPRGR